jgi:hypothetical protein
MIELNKNIRFIFDENNIYGRAALWPSRSSMSVAGVITAGGFKIQALPHLLGIIIGNVETAARNSGFASIPAPALSRWASEQAELIQKSGLPDEIKALSAELILEQKGLIGNLPLIRQGSKWYSIKQFRSLLRQVNELKIHIGEFRHNDSDDVGESSFDLDFEPNEEIFVIPTLRDPHSYIEGKYALYKDRIKPHIYGLIFELIKNNWRNYSHEEDFEFEVGDVNGIEINREIQIFEK